MTRSVLVMRFGEGRELKPVLFLLSLTIPILSIMMDKDKNEFLLPKHMMAAKAASQPIPKILRTQRQAASATRVNPSHGEAVKPTKLAWGSGAAGAHQVLP